MSILHKVAVLHLVLHMYRKYPILYLKCPNFKGLKAKKKRASMRKVHKCAVFSWSR